MSYLIFYYSSKWLQVSSQISDIIDSNRRSVCCAAYLGAIISQTHELVASFLPHLYNFQGGKKQASTNCTNEEETAGDRFVGLPNNRSLQVAQRSQIELFRNSSYFRFKLFSRTFRRFLILILKNIMYNYVISSSIILSLTLSV